MITSTQMAFILQKKHLDLFFKKPFLLLGQQDSLKELKNRGFKTFDSIFR